MIWTVIFIRVLNLKFSRNRRVIKDPEVCLVTHLFSFNFIVLPIFSIIFSFLKNSIKICRDYTDYSTSNTRIIFM